MTALIPMYHRVCPRSAATACYFERGTAVTPEAFARMLATELDKWGKVVASAGLKLE